MSTLPGKLIPALTALLGVIVAAPAPAQSNELSEIVVTARKRDESLQSVPVTIDAFTEAVDIMPTVLDFLGLATPPQLDGRSLARKTIALEAVPQGEVAERVQIDLELPDTTSPGMLKLAATLSVGKNQPCYAGKLVFLEVPLQHDDNDSGENRQKNLFHLRRVLPSFSDFSVRKSSPRGSPRAARPFFRASEADSGCQVEANHSRIGFALSARRNLRFAQARKNRAPEDCIYFLDETAPPRVSNKQPVALYDLRKITISAHFGHGFTSNREPASYGTLPSPFGTRRMRDCRSLQGT